MHNHCTSKAAVNWPAILKYTGDDELVYIENQQAWLHDPGLHSYQYTVGDQIIDSAGKAFDLIDMTGKKKNEITAVNKTLSPSTMTLCAFETLIKNHMHSLNFCCSSRLRISSFKDGISLIEKTQV